MKIITYFPAWAEERENYIQYDALTNIIYAFAIPTEEGNVFIDNPSFAKRLVDKSHKNNIKISIAVGGWSWEDIPLEPTFVKATDTDDKVEKLADSIIKLVDEYGFDGVDMDWEHPRLADGSGKRYEKLMLALADRLHPRGLILTSAVIGGVDANGNPGGIDTGGADVGNAAMAQTDAVLSAVDWLNVMAYDGPGEHHASYDYAVNSTKFWKYTRGLDGNKIALGVPFYGKPAGGAYENVLKAHPEEAPKCDILPMDGGLCHYNGAETMKRKVAFAKQEGLCGMMIWEVSGDTLEKEKSLQQAIYKAVSKDL